MNWVEFQKSNTAQVRIGEIGMSFGIHHAQIAAAAPDAQLVAACDVRDSQRAAVEQLGAHFYSDFRQMLNAEPLDGMVVAVPIHLHAEVSIACLEHGLPVLLEKPLASTLEDADRIIEATNRYGVPLLVGHQRRFSPFCELARETIANRDLGDLVGVSVLWTILKPQDYYSAHWRTRRETGGGPLLINAIHTIDDLRYITQLEVTRVYAETSNRTRGLEVEDTASILLYLQGGTLATIFLSDCTPSIWSYEATTAPWENPFFHYSPADCYHFFGTKGALTLPQMQYVHYANLAKQGWQFPIQIDRLGVQPTNPLRLEMSHFYRVIREEERPRTTATDARRTLETVLAVIDASDSQKPVALPY